MKKAMNAAMKGLHTAGAKLLLDFCMAQETAEAVCGFLTVLGTNMLQQSAGLSSWPREKATHPFFSIPSRPPDVSTKSPG